MDEPIQELHLFLEHENENQHTIEVWCPCEPDIDFGYEEIGDEEVRVLLVKHKTRH